MAKEKFFIHPRYENKPFVGIMLNHKRINLTGKDFTQVIPASSKGAETKVIWKGATQDDLAAYFKLGNQRIVYKDVDTSAGTSNV